MRYEEKLYITNFYDQKCKKGIKRFFEKSRILKIPPFDRIEIYSSFQTLYKTCKYNVDQNYKMEKY